MKENKTDLFVKLWLCITHSVCVDLPQGLRSDSADEPRTPPMEMNKMKENDKKMKCKRTRRCRLMTEHWMPMGRKREMRETRNSKAASGSISHTRACGASKIDGEKCPAIYQNQPRSRQSPCEFCSTTVARWTRRRAGGQLPHFSAQKTKLVIKVEKRVKGCARGGGFSSNLVCVSSLKKWKGNDIVVLRRKVTPLRW